MVDLKEMDRRGKVNSKIFRYMTVLNIDDLDEIANDMEALYEVQEARMRDIEDEHKEVTG